MGERSSPRTSPAREQFDRLGETVARRLTLCLSVLHFLFVIESIRHKGLKKLVEDNDASKLNAEHVAKIRRIVAALRDATVIDDLNVPTFKFHALTGDQKGRYSIKIQGGWCITFEFEDGQAKHVDYENYHKGKH